jgi:hypothetical protein
VNKFNFGAYKVTPRKSQTTPDSVTLHGYTLHNPDASATVSQRIMLHYLTGMDTKESRLTKRQACDLIYRIKNS